MLLLAHLSQLKRYAEATLGSGNLRQAVVLPEGEDLDEWLAVNSECLAGQGRGERWRCMRRGAEVGKWVRASGAGPSAGAGDGGVMALVCCPCGDERGVAAAAAGRESAREARARKGIECKRASAERVRTPSAVPLRPVVLS